MSSSCEDVRASLSAHIDGEDAQLSIAVVDRHVVACADCTGFAAGLPLLQERVAAFRAVPVPDRTADVVTAAAARDRRAAGPSSAQLRGLLGLAAAVQFVLALTLLAGLGDLVGLAGSHIARDLAAFELAAAGGLAATAWRPRLAAGLLPVIAVAAVVGLVTMIGDALAGTATLTAELPHLVLVVALWPVVTLAREEGVGGSVQHS